MARNADRAASPSNVRIETQGDQDLCSIRHKCLCSEREKIVQMQGVQSVRNENSHNTPLTWFDGGSVRSSAVVARSKRRSKKKRKKKVTPSFAEWSVQGSEYHK